MKSIAIFCGSSRGLSEVYAQAAETVIREMIGRRCNLVYGGGHVGLMGVLADHMIEGGGHVTGVIPRFLLEKEVAHMRLPELIVVDTMHERKMRMFELSDAFIALPGGFGTLDEFFEIVTWLQLGLHRKPVGILNVAGFFNPLLEQLAAMVREGFLKEENQNLIVSSHEAGHLLVAMETVRIPKIDKWIHLKQT
jgi:hypothetical protein